MIPKTRRTRRESVSGLVTHPKGRAKGRRGGNPRRIFRIFAGKGGCDVDPDDCSSYKNKSNTNKGIFRISISERFRMPFGNAGSPRCVSRILRRMKVSLISDRNREAVSGENESKNKRSPNFEIPL